MSILNVDSIQPVSTGSTVNIGNGDLTVGTGITIGRSGVVTATSFSGDGSNLTSIAGANITGIIPAAALGNVDLAAINANIAVLGFKVAANGSLTKYNLVDQVIDEFIDATGIDASASTAEQFISGSYTGGTAGNNHPTGGTITTYGNYKVHTFPTGSTNFVTAIPGVIDILAVAGGGGGGCGENGAGAGAGGMLVGTSVSVAAGTYAMVVGAGGAGGPGGSSSGTTGSQGNPTTTGGILATCVGGGGGANYGRNNTGNGGDGGSGGGTAENGGTAGQGTAGQGNDGQVRSSNSRSQPGAGGGAGEAGGVDGDRLGGDGLQNNFQTGSNQWYAGGGSAASDSNDGAVAGGDGGGGSGAGTNAAGGAGTDGTGGGGGGAGEHTSQPGGDGGDGIIVLRYDTTSQYNVTLGADMSLQSVANTASSVPTKGDLVILMEDDTGTAGINTDIKGYISRDGSNFTQGTLVNEGTWGTNKKILAFHNLDISGQPSGTSMKYKITTHNQGPTNKITTIHAASIGWK